MANYSLEIFESLCYRAKELVFNAINDDKTFQFVYTRGLREELPKLTPIEQIFLVAAEIQDELDMVNKEKNHFHLYYEPQKDIKAGMKYYRADFFIDRFEQPIRDECDTIYFSKPLIIEVDGKDWHSNRQQMNYDYGREQALKIAGYDVLCFTGSQVYNNPFDCVKSVRDYIKKNYGEKV